MSLTVIAYKGSGIKSAEKFFLRPAFSDKAEAVAGKILADIRKKGLSAVLKYAKAFDGSDLPSGSVRVTEAEIAKADLAVDVAFRKAVAETKKRVSDFALAGKKKNWSLKKKGRGLVGERFTALDRVGVYIPGGAAPLASTVLMTVPIAVVAGVKEIVACTPCRKDGTVNPYLLYALKASGATEIYKVGGVQAIGLMAYGAGKVRKVQKIVGPGGTFVTAAKRLVYGDVALDLVAGPSEIAVLADSSADPDFIAADLLSQAEHGTGWEKALLVTDSSRTARLAIAAVESLAKQRSRYEAIKKVMAKGMLVVLVKNIAEAAALCNKFAPEHLEIITKSPLKVLPLIKCAGAIFLGQWTPEPAGDFVAGPSHVLPTGGAATMFSGLTVDDFMRRSSVIMFSKEDLKKALPVIEVFGRVEGLDAHAESAKIRFRK